MMMDHEYEVGMAKSIAKGFENGARENAEQNAINCLKLGKLVIEDISTVTGFSLERVAELAQSIKQ